MEEPYDVNYNICLTKETYQDSLSRLTVRVSQLSQHTPKERYESSKVKRQEHLQDSEV